MRTGAMRLVFVVRCISCGFVLYRGSEPRTVEQVAKMWGGYCPKCMSPLERKPIKIAARIVNGAVPSQSYIGRLSNSSGHNSR